MLRIYTSELRSTIDHCAAKTAGERTPSDFTWSGLTLGDAAELAASIGVEAASIVDVYPLSPMQEGLLFHALHDSDGTAYFQQMAYRMSGPLDVPAFAAAWNQLTERHAALRTVFAHQGLKQPLQVVLRERAVDSDSMTCDRQR